MKLPCKKTSAQFPPRTSMLVIFGWPEPRPTRGNSCVASRRARRCFVDSPPQPARTLDARIRTQAEMRSFTSLVIRRRGEDCHLGQCSRMTLEREGDRANRDSGLRPSDSASRGMPSCASTTGQLRRGALRGQCRRRGRSKLPVLPSAWLDRRMPRVSHPGYASLAWASVPE